MKSMGSIALMWANHSMKHFQWTNSGLFILSDILLDRCQNMKMKIAVKKKHFDMQIKILQKIYLCLNVFHIYKVRSFSHIENRCGFYA